MPELNTNLIVRGESVQALFAQLRAGNLVVNRRYQRKLVWSIEEKQAFVDSLMRHLPVPLILVAERTPADGSRLEIIDGLQRLDAVFSFVAGEYQHNDGYFDLETLAETKQEFDRGNYKQRLPKLDRDRCTRFAGYNLPLSVYRADSEDEVDEIFRRVNSGGRHLSRQDLRQAGSTSGFAQLVRDIAATVRGDVSLSDIVDLADMAKISITSVPHGPGIFVDDVAWVSQRVLDREQVRESRDEEIIADLLVTMLIEPMPAYDSRVLDEFYGAAADVSSGESRSARLEAVIKRDTADGIKARFLAALSTFREIFDGGANQFATLMFRSSRQRVPRYFEAVFFGIDKLLAIEGRELADAVGARAALKHAGTHHIDIPSGGGTWTATSKRKNMDVVAGLLRDFTKPATAVANPVLERNALEVENLLRAAQVETSLVDFKQGFSELSDPPSLSDAIVTEIARTLSAMANHGREATGYVVVGIADTQRDAERVTALGGGTPTLVSGHYVTGLELDLAQHGSLDKLLLWFTSKVRASALPHELTSQILRDLRAVRFEGRTVLLLRVKSLADASPFGDSFFERQGSQTVEVPGGQVGRLFARFR